MAAKQYTIKPLFNGHPQRIPWYPLNQFCFTRKWQVKLYDETLASVFKDILKLKIERVICKQEEYETYFFTMATEVSS